MARVMVRAKVRVRVRVRVRARVRARARARARFRVRVRVRVRARARARVRVRARVRARVSPLHLLGLVLGRRREAHHVDGEAEEAEERQASSDAQHEEPAIPGQQRHEERDGLAEEGKAQ